MSEIALSGAPQQAFGEYEELLAKRSVRRGRSDVTWNGFWTFLVAGYWGFSFQNSILRCIACGVMAVAPLVAVVRLLQIKRSPFRCLTAQQQRFKDKPNPFIFAISLTFFPILLLAAERDYGSIALYICLLLFIFWPPYFWLRYHRRTFEILPDKIIHRWHWKDRKKKTTEEQVSETAIPYADIMRVEAPGYRNLQIYYFHGDTYTCLPIEEKDFGVGALAALLRAIEGHAPQAKFDDEADLMRRGCFSW